MTKHSPVDGDSPLALTQTPVTYRNFIDGVFTPASVTG